MDERSAIKAVQSARDASSKTEAAKRLIEVMSGESPARRRMALRKAGLPEADVRALSA